MDEKQFTRALSELKDLASLQGGFVSDIQIEECLPELTDEQKSLLCDYLKQSGIGINAPIDSKEAASREETSDGENTKSQDYLQMYLEELHEEDIIDESMKTLLLREALHGDKRSKEKLIHAYLPTVVDIARLYVGQGADMADLIGEGNVALAVAVDQLECVDTPEDADALIAKMIMNSMEEFIGLENDEEQLMEQILTDTARVLEQARRMAEELLRKVTVEELAKESGISEEDILTASKMAKECADYIDLPKESGQ